MSALRAMLADDAGATLVEYAVVTAALALAMAGVLAAIAAQCGVQLGATSSGMPSLGTTPP